MDRKKTKTKTAISAGQPATIADSRPAAQADSYIKALEASVWNDGHSPIQPAAIADSRPAENRELDQPSMADELNAAVLRNLPTTLGGSQSEPARRNRRRPAAPPPDPLQLDPDFVHSPERMQYALLLALLLRQKTGSATFSQRDLAHTDTDYNILFARTLDGKSLEVTVVSSQSGIIRSPAKEREAEQWKRAEEEKAALIAYQQLPQPSTHFSTSFTSGPAGPQDLSSNVHQAGSNPGGGLPRGTVNTPEQFPHGALQAGFGIPQAEMGPAPQKAAEVIQLPNRDPSTTTDGSTSYHFPFQVGANPREASGPTSPMNLDRMHQQLLAKELEVQNQEMEAIERQDRGE